LVRRRGIDAIEFLTGLRRHSQAPRGLQAADPDAPHQTSCLTGLSDCRTKVKLEIGTGLVDPTSCSFILEIQEFTKEFRWLYRSVDLRVLHLFTRD
jgi:hypothetical protein